MIWHVLDLIGASIAIGIVYGIPTYVIWCISRRFVKWAVRRWTA